MTIDSESMDNAAAGVQNKGAVHELGGEDSAGAYEAQAPRFRANSEPYNMNHGRERGRVYLDD